MAKKVEDTIAAFTGFPGDGGLGKPADDEDEKEETPEKPEESDEDEENTVDFPIPEGFEVPAGIKQGEEFTALATLHVDEDGDLCLTKIDGHPVTGESEEHEEEEAENKGEQNPPGATGAEGAMPTGGSAIASARNVLGEMGMPA